MVVNQKISSPSCSVGVGVGWATADRLLRNSTVIKMATAKQQVHLPFVSKNVEDLLLWRNRNKSALMFGGATAAFTVYLLNPFSASTIICYLIAIIALASFFWAQMGSFVSRSGPPVPDIFKRGLTEEEARKFADAALPTINKALGTVGILTSGRDMRLSLVVAGAAYSAANVFNVIGPITLAYVVVLAGFTLPKAYELKKAEVDKVVATVKAKVDELSGRLNEVVSKIPKASVLQRKVE